MSLSPHQRGTNSVLSWMSCAPLSSLRMKPCYCSAFQLLSWEWKLCCQHQPSFLILKDIIHLKLQLHPQHIFSSTPAVTLLGTKINKETEHIDGDDGKRTDGYYPIKLTFICLFVVNSNEILWFIIIKWIGCHNMFFFNVCLLKRSHSIHFSPPTIPCNEEFV